MFLSPPSPPIFVFEGGNITLYIYRFVALFQGADKVHYTQTEP